MRFLLLSAAAALVACSGTIRMGGFSEGDARAKTARVTPVDVCDTRAGRLVVELQRVVIREYPHHHADAHAQQPLVLRSLEDAEGRVIDGDRGAWVAPARYHAGDEIDAFRGLVVFDRPVRQLAGRKQLVLRVAENDRSVAPAWIKRAEDSAGAVGAVSIVGVPAPPSAVLKQAIELVRKVDRDDLILIWSIDVDDLRKALAAGHRPGAHWPALSYELETPAAAKDAKAPRASMSLLVYLSPEPGCPMP